MRISENILKQLIQEELSLLLGEAIGFPTPEEIAAMNPSQRLQHLKTGQGRVQGMRRVNRPIPIEGGTVVKPTTTKYPLVKWVDPAAPGMTVVNQPRVAPPQ